MNLVNKLLEDSAVWFVRGRVIISEKQDLVLEGLVKGKVLQAYVDVSKVQRGFFLKRYSEASMIL